MLPSSDFDTEKPCTSIKRWQWAQFCVSKYSGAGSNWQPNFIITQCNPIGFNATALVTKCDSLFGGNAGHMNIQTVPEISQVFLALDTNS